MHFQNIEKQLISNKMKFTFIKNQQHRTFQYKPVFYDEAKEEMDERKRRVREELGLKPEDDGSSPADRIRGKMNRRIQTNFEVSRKEKRKSTVRLIAIIAILLVFFYYLLYSSSEWILKYL